MSNENKKPAGESKPKPAPAERPNTTSRLQTFSNQGKKINDPKKK